MSNHPVIQEIAEKVAAEAPRGHTGGPIRIFEMVGRDCFMTVLYHGLSPFHRVLDFGCGSLRAGYWLVRFLDEGCYYGLDPDIQRIDAGVRHVLDSEILAAKRPSFITASDCDMEAFGVPFDYVIARSVFTHLGPALVHKSLASFAKAAAPGSRFLTSYWAREGQYVHQADGFVIGDDCSEDDESYYPYLKYSFEFMQQAASRVGLKVHESIPWEPINDQIWLVFERAED